VCSDFLKIIHKPQFTFEWFENGSKKFLQDGSLECLHRMAQFDILKCLPDITNVTANIRFEVLNSGGYEEYCLLGYNV
jgi:hypothetical protein